jgi:hypothetical protein
MRRTVAGSARPGRSDTYVAVRRKPNYAADSTSIHHDPSKVHANQPAAMEREMHTAKQGPATVATSNRSHGLRPPDAHAHRQRCKTLPSMQPGEAERLTADFLANRRVTLCPTRYAAPIEQLPYFVQSGY